MATKLDKPLKREIAISGKPFVLILSPDGFKLVAKGRRKGLEISWEELVNGNAALATALSASLDPELRLEPGRGARSSKSRSR